MKYKPFNIIRAEYPELLKWLKSISRYDRIEDFIIPDYKDGVRVSFYTKDHSYHISAIKKGERKGLDFGDKEDNGYLGCISQTRKPRAGEDWTRGNDLADGDFSKKTWYEILGDIVCYELVRIHRPIRHLYDENSE